MFGLESTVTSWPVAYLGPSLCPKQHAHASVAPHIPQRMLLFSRVTVMFSAEGARSAFCPCQQHQGQYLTFCFSFDPLCTITQIYHTQHGCDRRTKILRFFKKTRFTSSWLFPTFWNELIRAGRRENCKWYSSLPLGAVVMLFCESA
jgi:hypothetical protein